MNDLEEAAMFEYGHAVQRIVASRDGAHEFGVDAAQLLGRRVRGFQRELAATPHLWALIAIVYSYLALFALVVVLAVARP